MCIRDRYNSLSEISILASQSNVFNLLQPPDEQPPLLLQPFVFPSADDPHDAQPIILFLVDGGR